MNLTEVEELFSKDKSERRVYIMNQYKIYLDKLLKTNHVLKHWIDGSFVTLKEEPGDIDLLTEFNGIGVDNEGKHEEIQDFIDYAPYITDHCCHSLGIFKYPEEYEEEYENYIYTKTTTLDLFSKNKESDNSKGFIELDLVNGVIR